MTAGDLGRLLYLSSRLEVMVRGKPDEDHVAKIVVHIETRTTPRYLDPDVREKEADEGNGKPN